MGWEIWQGKEKKRKKKSIDEEYLEQTHPRSAQSLSLSGEEGREREREKKKHLSTDNQRFKPCQVPLLSSVLPLLPAPSHLSSLLLSVSRYLRSRSRHLTSPRLFFRSQIFISCGETNRWTPPPPHPSLCRAAGTWNLCIYVCDQLDIKFMQACSGSRWCMYL